jgi:hypothetical protein
MTLGTALSGLVALLPSSSGEPQIHVRCKFVPFTRQEAHAAAAAGGPGAAEQLRQLGLTDSAVPALLRSGVLTVYIEKAEGLSSRMHDAGFTRNIKVKVSVGDVSKVTERSKVALLHRRDPVFNEGMELLVDAETATCQDEQVEVEVFIAHNWRRDSFKVRHSTSQPAGPVHKGVL